MVGLLSSAGAGGEGLLQAASEAANARKYAEILWEMIIGGLVCEGLTRGRIQRLALLIYFGHASAINPTNRHFVPRTGQLRAKWAYL